MTTFDGSLRLRNFCMMNPDYLKVLDILEKADTNDWERTADIRKKAGIDTGSKGCSSWQVFIKLAGERCGCGYVESASNLKGRERHHKAYIRAIPEKKSNIREFLEKVTA